MNKAGLIEKVKKSPILYKIYYHVMSSAVNILKRFIKTDDNLILFVSYGGRYFNDSPKSIYDAMKDDIRFKHYRLVWAFRNPDQFPVKEKVKIDSFSFYKVALSARCWITNVNIERGLNFTGRHTYYFHTTHGTLPKLSGNDVREGGFFGWDFNYRYDCSCAQSEEEKRYQLHMFNLKPEQVLVCGYPKNDRLANYNVDEIRAIKQKLGLPEGKKVLLYAPTFREDNPTGITIPVDFAKWRKLLGDEYIVLFRAHPIVVNSLKLEKMDGFLYDVSSYPDNVELMLVSDALISDYSGIFFEYAILGRPMYCFAYDYEEYQEKRGLYFDIREELPGGFLDETGLIKLIASNEDVMPQVREFSQKYVTAYGNATKISLDNIFSNIQ